MPEPQITPHRITKPIQLLGAWLAGLAIIDGSFLTAAASIQSPTWVPGALVVASIVNVPLFLFGLFLLQTKFRPEMQEDSYYADYLQKKDSDTPAQAVPAKAKRPLRELAADIVAQVSTEPIQDQPKQQEKVEELLRDSEVNYLAKRFSDNRALSELQMFPNLWGELVNEFGTVSTFKGEIDKLVDVGLVALPSGTPVDAKLTSIGKEVAKKLEDEDGLWNQRHKRRMPDDKKSDA